MKKNNIAPYLILSITITFISFQANAAKSRTELRRYAEMTDKLANDQFLINPHHHYVSFSPSLSSGLWDFFNDVNNSADSSASDAQKELDIKETLFKNLNTEKFLNLNFNLQSAMTNTQWGRGRIYIGPSLGFNAGTSMSINNTQTATSPQAQIYARLDTRYGLNFLYQSDDKKISRSLNLYYLNRKDMSLESSASDIVDSNELINTDDAEFVGERYIMLDIREDYRLNQKTLLHFSVSEIRLAKRGDGTTVFGTPPLYHFAVRRQYLNKGYDSEIVFGFYHRKLYSMDNGIYASYQADLKDSPFSFHTKLDSEFFNLGINLRYRDFQLSYLRKTPHTNNDRGVWVANTHQVYLSWKL